LNVYLFDFFVMQACG